MWCQGMNNSGCGTNSCNTNSFCGCNNWGSCRNRCDNQCRFNSCGSSWCGNDCNFCGANSCGAMPYSNILGATTSACPTSGTGTLFSTSGCPLTGTSTLANMGACPLTSAETLSTTTLFDPYTQTYQTEQCPLTATRSQYVSPKIASQTFYEDSIAMNGRCPANGNMG